MARRRREDDDGWKRVDNRWVDTDSDLYRLSAPRACDGVDSNAMGGRVPGVGPGWTRARGLDSRRSGMRRGSAAYGSVWTRVQAPRQRDIDSRRRGAHRADLRVFD